MVINSFLRYLLGRIESYWTYMNCPVCQTVTELKTFNFFQYDYCPRCREDIEHLKKIASPILEVVKSPQTPWKLDDVLYCIQSWKSPHTKQQFTKGNTYKVKLIIENEDVELNWYVITLDAGDEGGFDFKWGKKYFELLPF